MPARLAELFPVVFIGEGMFFEKNNLFAAGENHRGVGFPGNVIENVPGIDRGKRANITVSCVKADDKQKRYAVFPVMIHLGEHAVPPKKTALKKAGTMVRRRETVPRDPGAYADAGWRRREDSNP